MPTNPLFQPSNSPTRTTKPTKAVNETSTHVSLTHNTFDNSYFNFKTQRYGKYEPFFWKDCIPGDVEPFSNSHNVRSLPFANPILSPMKLNKDYFLVPRYAIQPNTWDYIYKTPNQGDDVPTDAQNIFPLRSNGYTIFQLFQSALSYINEGLSDPSIVGSESFSSAFLTFVMYENFLSAGSLLFQMGFKNNFVFESAGITYSFDEIFDILVNSHDFYASFRFDDPDSPSSYRDVSFSNGADVSVADYYVDKFTFFSLLRSHFGSLRKFIVVSPSSDVAPIEIIDNNLLITSDTPETSVDFMRMDNIVAYQLACAQYYVNPRVDFIYNAQLYRDNFVQLIRELYTLSSSGVLNIESFDYNGIPVLYDYFSYRYYDYLVAQLCFDRNFFDGDYTDIIYATGRVLYYLFGFQDQLRFGDYLVDSRTQALGYGEPGSDSVQIYDNSVSVTDMSQKLVLQRYRSAVAHLDNTAEDYLETMFHEQLPPDYHFPKFVIHSEFGINGEEVSNTTSDDQGNIVTNLKSGDDSAEFEIKINVSSILVGISYVSIPGVYCQTKERHYFHQDRYDMFQPMLQYFGDQGIYNREVSDTIPNPSDVYGYTSRNGEYKQRMSQCSGAFLTSLRSWLFTVDLPEFAKESSLPRLANTQSPLSIRTFDFEFNRFLSRQTGVSLGTGFHFIMQYNNKNVDNRPMDVNPLPLYPSNQL